jgi:isopropylmalate/homocitrate/citramalate synthase
MLKTSARVSILAGMFFIEDKPVFLHLHDTEGKGLANALAAVQVGIAHFDTGFGGTGGCPFIKCASGNISTEDKVKKRRARG